MPHVGKRARKSATAMHQQGNKGREIPKPTKPASQSQTGRPCHTIRIRDKRIQRNDEHERTTKGSAKRLQLDTPIAPSTATESKE